LLRDQAKVLDNEKVRHVDAVALSSDVSAALPQTNPLQSPQEAGHVSPDVPIIWQDCHYRAADAHAPDGTCIDIFASALNLITDTREGDSTKSPPRAAPLSSPSLQLTARAITETPPRVVPTADLPLQPPDAAALAPPEPATTRRPNALLNVAESSREPLNEFNNNPIGIAGSYPSVFPAGGNGIIPTGGAMSLTDSRWLLLQDDASLGQCIRLTFHLAN
jgi:hypothetical protein